MARDLPPLNAIRIFEAAARHLSFTRAADELHVTQAAISHQMKALEARLGVALFRRAGRGLVLTEAAQTYLADVRLVLDRLAEATRRLKAQERSGVLTATILPSFAAKWLLPRLPRFRAAHPEIDLRISSDSRAVDFAHEEFDLGIRTGRGAWPGLRAELIARAVLFPVCSPALLTGAHPLRVPADLRWHTLLHDEPRDGWRMWLNLVEADGVDPERGPGFSTASLVIQAAVEGHGVALASDALARDDLLAGRLVRPFAASLPADYAYWLVYPEPYATRPKLVAFRDWLIAEAAASRDEIGAV
jgi:LysR family transcriptional regulator, glycine cleavage system transcriptional activator